MSELDHQIIAELHLRLEQAEQLLRSAMDDNADDAGLRHALEGVHVATINFNSFVGGLTN